MQRGIVLTLGAAVLWGTSFPVIDVGLERLHPLTFAALRFVLASVSLGIAAWLLGRWRPALLRDRSLWVLGAFTTASFLLQFVAQTLTTPGKTALLINLSVFPVAGLSWMMYGERLGGSRLPAVLLAGSGVLLLTTGGRLDALQGGALLGDALAFLAGLAWAGFAVLSKPAVDRLGAIPVSVSVFLVASLALGAIALPFGTPPPLEPASLGIAGYVGVMCTALAFALFTAGLRSLTPTVSAVVLVLEIVVALALSLALAREAMTLEKGLGAALVVAAVALASRAARTDPANRGAA